MPPQGSAGRDEGRCGSAGVATGNGEATAGDADDGDDVRRLAGAVVDASLDRPAGAQGHRCRPGQSGIVAMSGRGNVTAAETLTGETIVWTGWFMAADGRWCAAAIVTVSVLALAGCEDAPAPAPAPSVAAAPALAPAASGGIVLSPQPDSGAASPPAEPVLANDPSAPTNTPLCGAAVRETDAIGQALLPRQYAAAGICQSFACYDPATATYIGRDGYRHVCR